MYYLNKFRFDERLIVIVTALYFSYSDYSPAPTTPGKAYFYTYFFRISMTDEATDANIN